MWGKRRMPVKSHAQCPLRVNCGSRNRAGGSTFVRKWGSATAPSPKAWRRPATAGSPSPACRHRGGDFPFGSRRISPFGRRRSVQIITWTDFDFRTSRLGLGSGVDANNCRRPRCFPNLLRSVLIDIVHSSVWLDPAVVRRGFRSGSWSMSFGLGIVFALPGGSAANVAVGGGDMVTVALASPALF